MRRWVLPGGIGLAVFTYCCVAHSCGDTVCLCPSEPAAAHSLLLVLPGSACVQLYSTARCSLQFVPSCAVIKARLSTVHTPAFVQPVQPFRSHRILIAMSQPQPIRKTSSLEKIDALLQKVQSYTVAAGHQVPCWRIRAYCLSS